MAPSRSDRRSRLQSGFPDHGRDGRGKAVFMRIDLRTCFALTEPGTRQAHGQRRREDVQDRRREGEIGLAVKP